MNTTTYHPEINIDTLSNESRIFRGLAALAAILAILVGGLSTPVLLISLSITSIYLAHTAIIGQDPVLVLANYIQSTS